MVYGDARRELIEEQERERQLKLRKTAHKRGLHHHKKRKSAKHHHQHKHKHHDHKHLNHIKLNNNHDPNRHLSKRDRKLLFTFSWDANEKRFSQRQIMQQLVRKG